MNASRSEAALRHLKAATTTKDEVFLGHPHVVEANVHMAVGCIVVAINLHRTQDFDTACAGGNEYLRVAPVLFRRGVGANHDDVDLAAWVAGTGGEPLFAV